MKTAQDCFKLAAQMTKAAELVRPHDSQQYREAFALVEYHLKSGATKLREVGEHITARENAR